MLNDAQWLGLCCSTESSKPHEFPFIAWTVRNRVEAKRQMFGAGYPGVILKPMQFSAFNGITGTSEEVYAKVKAKQHASTLELAEHCAAWVLGTPTQNSPLTPLAFYYWSPISMVPVGKLPAWDWAKLRRFTWPGVDPWRFLAAEEIR